MRSPLRAVREFREEFSRVMHEHERFLGHFRGLTGLWAKDEEKILG